MNKIMLLGRLTKDPELRYSQSATPLAICKYGLAVRRQYAKQGETDVDFFNITAFGKAAEFAEKHFRKGQQVVVVGRVQVQTWEHQTAVKHTSYTVIAEEQHFAGDKVAGKSNQGASAPQQGNTEPPAQWDNSYEDDLPF